MFQRGWKYICYIISGAGYDLSGLLMAYVPQISELMSTRMLP